MISSSCIARYESNFDKVVLVVIELTPEIIKQGLDWLGGISKIAEEYPELKGCYFERETPGVTFANWGPSFDRLTEVESGAGLRDYADIYPPRPFAAAAFETPGDLALQAISPVMIRADARGLTFTALLRLPVGAIIGTAAYLNSDDLRALSRLLEREASFQPNEK